MLCDIDKCADLDQQISLNTDYRFNQTAGLRNCGWGLPHANAICSVQQWCYTICAAVIVLQESIFCSINGVNLLVWERSKVRKETCSHPVTRGTQLTATCPVHTSPGCDCAVCLVQFNQYPTIWWLSVVNLYFETETAPILPCWRRKDLHGIYHLFLAEVSWCLAEQSRVAAGQDSAAPPPGASSLHLKTWVWARNSPAPCHLTWPAAAEPATTSMWTPQPRVSRRYWSSHCQFTGVEVTEVTYQWPVYWPRYGRVSMFRSPPRCWW